MRMFRRYRLLGLCQILASALLCAACSYQGPGATRTSHLAYNEAVQASEQRELLLNIVRLRYLDSPEFLAISSISTQLRIDARVGAIGVFGDGEGGAISTIAPDASVGYEEAPVVTFTPRRDAQFTRELIEPTSIESIYLLSSYGWGIERVLALIVESLNELENDAPRELVPDRQSAAAQRFFLFCTALGSLQDRGLVKLHAEPGWVPASAALPVTTISASELIDAADKGLRLRAEGPDQIMLERRAHRYLLRFAPGANGTDAADELATLAGLEAGSTALRLVGGADSGIEEGDLIRVQTRSVLGSLAWMSNAVDVPANHLANGLAPPRDAVAARMAHWFAVSYSRSEPSNAWLAVPYRQHWYYIDAADLNSRRTFGLLTSLVRLEIGAANSHSPPVLTLPVSR